MKKAIGYIRVSTEQQAGEGVSLEAQRAKVESWCRANGFELVAVEADAGISGGAELDKRPGLLRALDAVRRCKAEVLVVVKRDRLARDYMLAGMAERLVAKAGAKVVATDGGGNGDAPEDMLMRGIQDVFAQYERLLIKFRTKVALAHKKAKGEKYAPVPFGFREVEGRLVEVEAEARVVAHILRQRQAGRTLVEIADELNTQGIQGKRGGRWYASTVRYLIQRQAA